MKAECKLSQEEFSILFIICFICYMLVFFFVINSGLDQGILTLGLYLKSGKCFSCSISSHKTALGLGNLDCCALQINCFSPGLTPVVCFFCKLNSEGFCQKRLLFITLLYGLSYPAL